VTLALAYQGDNFAALCTDSVLGIVPRNGMTVGAPTHFANESKCHWANYRRLNFVISATLPGAPGTVPKSLPATALDAARSLQNWIAPLNPGMGHAIVIGSPLGEPPTVHRVIWGVDIGVMYAHFGLDSLPSETTAQPGEVLAAGGLQPIARQMNIERNVGLRTQKGATAMLVAFAASLINRAREFTRQGDPIVYAAWPLRVAIVTATDSRELEFHEPAEVKA
jgi:hypothetical protein